MDIFFQFWLGVIGSCHSSMKWNQQDCDGDLTKGKSRGRCLSCLWCKILSNFCLADSSIIWSVNQPSVESQRLSCLELWTQCIECQLFVDRWNIIRNLIEINLIFFLLKKLNDQSLKQKENYRSPAPSQEIGTISDVFNSIPEDIDAFIEDILGTIGNDLEISDTFQDEYNLANVSNTPFIISDFQESIINTCKYNIYERRK